MTTKALLSVDHRQVDGVRRGCRSAALATILLVIAAMVPSGAPALTRGAMPTDPETVAQVRGWNAECLQCHVGDSLQGLGRGLFGIPKGEGASVRVSPSYVASNHGNMACKSCHVGGYVAYPHAVAEGRKAETLDCDECHAQETFRVEPQVERSVHSKNLKEDFTCSTCHDPHVVASAKRLGSVEKLVLQDNTMCLNCHNSDERFSAFSAKALPDKKRPDIDAIHAWLPNAQLHWQAVRCIDCHTPPSTHRSLALSHEILNKDKAQRDCTTCHSQDSALRARLYRHVAEVEARELGFMNAAIMRNSYVIGATRNTYLDMLGLIMVGGTLAAVIIHGLLRIIAARLRRTT